jgi:hypothetical protein
MAYKTFPTKKQGLPHTMFASDLNAEFDELLENEITPAMIEAGEDALRQFDLFSVAEGWDSKGEVVRAILDAVFRVVPAKDP